MLTALACHAGASTAVLACAFHTYLPPKTAVDRMVEAEALVLARPDPADPFRFKVDDIVRHGDVLPEIPHLVDSPTRRRLAANPDHAVFFAYDADEDLWSRIAYANPEIREWIHRTEPSSMRWKKGPQTDRLKMAEALLTDRNPFLRNLALSELDRAPYSDLRTVTVPLSGDALLANFWDMSEVAYQPVRILLLGLTEDPAARVEVKRAVERSARYRTSANLGPWATALIELEGAEGVKMLETLFFADQSQPETSRELIIEALAMHETAAAEPLQRAIGDALGALVGSQPDAAVMVARQFMTRSNWSQVGAIKDALGAGRIRTGPDLVTLATYVAMGESQRSR